MKFDTVMVYHVDGFESCVYRRLSKIIHTDCISSLERMKTALGKLENSIMHAYQFLCQQWLLPFQA